MLTKQHNLKLLNGIAHFSALFIALALCTTQGALAQSQGHCEPVQGDGFAAGPFPTSEPNLIRIEGDVHGDVEGTITFYRLIRGGAEQQGSGATFASYHLVELDTVQRGLFIGSAEGHHNFSFTGEGERSTTGIFRVEYNRPDGKEGWMILKGDFTLHETPPTHRADFRYQGQLCSPNT